MNGSEDFGYRRYRANLSWARSNMPLLILGATIAFFALTAIYAWGHAMGKRDLVAAAVIAGAEARGGR